MQPASGFGDQPRRNWRSVYGDIDSPMFMFSGSADILVSGSWVRRGFNALSARSEAYYWEKSGSVHIPVPNRETVEVGIPWFRWKLLGDQDACEAFYDVRSDFSWSVKEEQNTVQCGEGGSRIGGGGNDGLGGDSRGWGWWSNLGR